MVNDEEIAEFYEMVDKFIYLANNLNENHNTTKISSVMMFAAARFNAFNFFVTDGEIQNEESAISHLCEQYKLMLKDNFDETRDFHSKQTP